jgi:thioredoxin 1
MKSNIGNSINKIIKDHTITLLAGFYADWSASSYIMIQLLKDIEKEYEGKLIVIYVNADEEPDICKSYGITQIPGILIFKNGKVVKTLNGMQSRSELTDVVTDIFNN